MWSTDDLGVSHLQASSMQTTQNIDNVSTAMRTSCDRVEKIESILAGGRDVLDRRICQPCLSEIDRKSESTYKLAMMRRKQYQYFVSNDSVSGKSHHTGRSISVDKYLQTVNYEQLLTAVYDLEQEVRILNAKEEELSKKYRNETGTSAVLYSERIALEKTIGGQQLREDQAKDSLISSLQLLDSSSREINFLRQASSSSATLAVPVLFDRVCLHPSNCGVLNGHRLAYRADTQLGLNWTEVSFSWASVAKLLCCVRNRHGLPKCVDFSVLSSPGLRKAYLAGHSAVLSSSSSSSLPVGIGLGDATGGYALRILPLQDRALLLLELDHPSAKTAAHAVLHAPKPHISIKPAYADARGASFTSSVPRGPAAAATGAARSEQWTLHLEGGMWENLPSRAAAVALAEYRCAVLLLCSAVVVTLLEVRTLHLSSVPESSTAGPSLDRSKTGVAEWWAPLQELLQGRMRDLACALLVLEGELELHRSIADDVFSTGASTMQSGFFGGSVMGASTASASPRPHTSIFAFPSVSSFSGSPPLPPAATAGTATGNAAVASSGSAATSAPHGCGTPQDEWARRLRVLTDLRASHQAQEGRGGNQRLDVLSCLLALAGLHPPGIEALMESVVADLLKTIQQNS